MQPKRSTFLVICTTAFVILAFFFVFWMSSRSSGSKPNIQLPDPSQNRPSAPYVPALLNDPADFLQFDLSPDTVTQILTELKTPYSYSQSLQSTVYTDGSSGTTQISVFVNGNLARISATDAKTQKEYLLTEEYVYAWSPDTPNARQAVRGAFHSAHTSKMPDLAELIALPSDQIHSVVFTEYNGLWAICMEYVTAYELSERSYILIDNGLIVRNEVYDGDSLILETTVLAQNYDTPDTSLFILPDGTTPQ